jgi:hypothetical protein
MIMKLAPVFTILALGLTPVHAQDAPANPEIAQGGDLLEQGAKLLLKGLLSEMEPALDDMSKSLAEAEPVLRDLMAMIGDIRNYNAPELQPNGDILIRRKTPAEIALIPEGEIEL